MPIVVGHDPNAITQSILGFLAGFGAQKRAYEQQENQQRAQVNQNRANAFGGAIGNIGSSYFNAQTKLALLDYEKNAQRARDFDYQQFQMRKARNDLDLKTYGMPTDLIERQALETNIDPMAYRRQLQEQIANTKMQRLAEEAMLEPRWTPDQHREISGLYQQLGEIDSGVERGVYSDQEKEALRAPIIERMQQIRPRMMPRLKEPPITLESLESGLFLSQDEYGGYKYVNPKTGEFSYYRAASSTSGDRGIPDSVISRAIQNASFAYAQTHPDEEVPGFDHPEVIRMAEQALDAYQRVRRKYSAQPDAEGLGGVEEPVAPPASEPPPQEEPLPQKGTKPTDMDVIKAGDAEFRALLNKNQVSPARWGPEEVDSAYPMAEKYLAALRKAYGEGGIDTMPRDLRTSAVAASIVVYKMAQQDTEGQQEPDIDASDEPGPEVTQELEAGPRPPRKKPEKRQTPKPEKQPAAAPAKASPDRFRLRIRQEGDPQNWSDAILSQSRDDARAFLRSIEPLYGAGESLDDPELRRLREYAEYILEVAPDAGQ